MIARMSRAIRRDQRGAVLVEFAVVAPVMCVLLLAAFDVSHTLYTRAVLQGLVQKTGRDFTLETGSAQAQQNALDEKVQKQARALNNTADIAIDRRYYRTFTAAAAAQAETWTDTNGNGTCDGPSGSTPGEPYQDANNNSRWDDDGADAGLGGAKDAVVYTVTMTYPRMVPIYSFIGGSNMVKVEAATVLRNQPYGDQGSYGAPAARNCT